MSGCRTDRRTARFYSDSSEELCDRYLGAPVPDTVGLLARNVPPGGSVLDIGAGSGRDMAAFMDMGFQAYGVDSSPRMVASAVKRNPALKGRLIQGDIVQGEPFFGFLFDGILCSALLMHLPDGAAEQGIRTMAVNMKKGGCLVISVPLKREGLDEQGRDSEGRLFILREPEHYKETFSRYGFEFQENSSGDDSLGRSGVTWLTMLFRLV